MFKDLAEDIAFYLIKWKWLAIEKRNVYVYGMEVLLLNLCIFISILTISIVGNEVLFCILFLLFFAPIRMYAGGYHAKTSGECFIISNILFLGVLLIYMNHPYLYKNVVFSIVFYVSILLIFLLSPVEHINHKLNENQKIQNGRRVKVIVSIICLLYSFCMLIRWYLSTVIALATIVVAFLMIIEWIINKQSQQLE